MQITKEQLLSRAKARLERMQEAMREHSGSPDACMDLRLAEIALASLEAEDKIPELRQVIYHFRDWNEGFPIERFKADYVISWMLANYPPAPPAPQQEVMPDA